MSEFLAFAAIVLPEMIVGTGICVVLLAGMGGGEHGREAAYLLAVATLAAAAWATLTGEAGEVAAIPGGAFVVDPIARVLKLFVFGTVAAVLVYSRAYMRWRHLEAGEFYVLVMFALLGILVMISAGSFLVIYLGVETLAPGPWLGHPGAHGTGDVGDAGHRADGLGSVRGGGAGHLAAGGAATGCAVRVDRRGRSTPRRKH